MTVQWHGGHIYTVLMDWNCDKSAPALLIDAMNSASASEILLCHSDWPRIKLLFVLDIPLECSYANQIHWYIARYKPCVHSRRNWPKDAVIFRIKPHDP